MLVGMEILVMIAVFALVGIAAAVGWTPDTRTGRDWQPRDGWKPLEDLRRPPRVRES
jgi:hypothetical protein